MPLPTIELTDESALARAYVKACHLLASTEQWGVETGEVDLTGRLQFVHPYGQWLDENKKLVLPAAIFSRVEGMDHRIGYDSEEGNLYLNLILAGNPDYAGTVDEDHDFNVRWETIVRRMLYLASQIRDVSLHATRPAGADVTQVYWHMIHYWICHLNDQQLGEPSKVDPKTFGGEGFVDKTGEPVATAYTVGVVCEWSL